MAPPLLKYKHKSPDAQRYFYAKQGVDYTTLTIDAPSVFFRCDDAPSQSAATAGADGHVEWGAAETACLAAGDADADADAGSVGGEGAVGGTAKKYEPPTVAALTECLAAAGWSATSVGGAGGEKLNALQVDAPVGRAEHSNMVMAGTLLCTVGGACVLAASIVKHSGDDAIAALLYSFGLSDSK